MEMRPRESGLQARLIDPKLTNGLRQNLRYNLRQRGVTAFTVDQMIRHDRAAADSVLYRYVSFSPRMKSGMLNSTLTLSNDEKIALRTGAEIAPTLFEKVRRHVSAATAASFKAMGRDLSLISIFDAAYSLQFRYAIAAECAMIEWCRTGGLESRRDETMANDMFDLAPVAYGTYFDKVLATDSRLLRIATLAKAFTHALIDAPLVMVGDTNDSDR